MRAEAGFVALGLLVLLVLAAVGARSASPARAYQEARLTARALAEARDALLGFALTYPNRTAVSNRAAGVGLLPCPDTRLDANDVAGQADPPCALSSGTETGLLPWRTLAATDLRDAAGGPLWYAVANANRNNPAGTVNSDIGAGLHLDDCAQTARTYAALVLAPGAALSGQNRNLADKAARYLASNYLELDNASRGDACFGNPASEQANDIALGITREAVNPLLEDRVLGEVARALRRYHADPAGLGATQCGTGASVAECRATWPWLAPWRDPGSASFISEVGVRRGLLPLRRVGVVFPAPFTAAWRLGAGSFVTSGVTPPAEACMRNTVPCSVLLGGGEDELALPAPSGVGSGSCVWNGGSRMRCNTSQHARTANDGTFERRWQIDFEALPRTLQVPDASHPRRETAGFAGALSGNANIRVHAADFLDGELQGEATLVLGAGAAVTNFELGEIPFDLEVDDDGVIDPPARRSPGELPAWLVANRWHHALLVALAEGATPGRDEPACTDGTPCLTLQTDRGATRSAAAALVLAGASLPHQIRNRGQRSDWFEQENANSGDALRAGATTASFNDRVLRIDVGD